MRRRQLWAAAIPTLASLRFSDWYLAYGPAYGPGRLRIVSIIPCMSSSE